MISPSHPEFKCPNRPNSRRISARELTCRLSAARCRYGGIRGLRGQSLVVYGDSPSRSTGTGLRGQSLATGLRGQSLAVYGDRSTGTVPRDQGDSPSRPGGQSLATKSHSHEWRGVLRDASLRTLRQYAICGRACGRFDFPKLSHWLRPLHGFWRASRRVPSRAPDIARVRRPASTSSRSERAAPAPSSRPPGSASAGSPAASSRRQGCA